jgi:hypothetical protein
VWGQLGKHASVATDMHATIEELLEMVFYATYAEANAG